MVVEGNRGRLYLSGDVSPHFDADRPELPFLRQSITDDKRWFSPPQYGLHLFADLFTPRQVVALTTFCDLVEKARERVLADAKRPGLPDDDRPLISGGTGTTAYGDAVATFLACALARSVDYNSAFASWRSKDSAMRATLGKQAIPMVWDFAEANPLEKSSAGFSDCTRVIAKCVELLPANLSGNVTQLDATAALNGAPHPFVCTDPPYYDNIGYADLSDYFYIWLRRSIAHIYPGLYSTVLTPKTQELIASSHRHSGDKEKAREADYERRIKMAYPIHPEMFDRLYNDWSTLDKFQRTRGVLRLMAAVIHSLWERQDSNVLIMPGNVPVDDQIVQFELTRYLEDQWVPVIEKDVDGANSLPLNLDRENPNLGRYSACRRVARTIYMGSAPMQRAAHRGIDDRQVKLGCVQPGEAVATFGDALRRLTDSATYLYVDGKRYWYSTQPTVTRLADDRGAQMSDDQVSDEIIKRLREQARTRSDFSKVHACVPSSDVPDEREARLVILGPDFPHTNRDDKSPARREAAAILDSRGSSPRNFRNTLVFLAGDVNRLRELEQAVRQYLAWLSIWDDRVTLNLDQFQTRQAETKRKSADEAIDLRITEAYQWLLVPAQPDPKGEVVWTDLKLQGQDKLATRAAKKLKNEESLVTQMGGVRLRTELDRIPLWTGNHVSIKQLAEYMARYLYLPRLRDEQVLLAAIQEGVASLMWQRETFAYAQGSDEQRQRYLGLRAGQSTRVVVDDRSLLVKPDVAAAQFDAERQPDPFPTNGPEPEPGRGSGSVSTTHTTGSGRSTTTTITPQTPQLRRFHGSVTLDARRLGRDASRIAEEVVQHLSSIVGADVQITLDIQAGLPENASDKLVRDVTENCRTLKFDDFGFEEK